MVQGLWMNNANLMPEPTVCISIVTFNSSRYIRRCLNAVLAQKGVRADRGGGG